MRSLTSPEKICLWYATPPESGIPFPCRKVIFSGAAAGTSWNSGRNSISTIWKQPAGCCPTWTAISRRFMAGEDGGFLTAACLPVQKRDLPVGTCFLWKAYGKLDTLHWLKVKPEYEGKGIGRALIARVLQEKGLGSRFPAYHPRLPPGSQALSGFWIPVSQRPSGGRPEKRLAGSHAILPGTAARPVL